jgi:hypothetical protein
MRVQMAEVAVPWQMLKEILMLIARLRAPPAAARPADQGTRPQETAKNGEQALGLSSTVLTGGPCFAAAKRRL